MEKQDILKAEVGIKESETLKSAAVQIKRVRVEDIGDKKNQKVVYSVKHPEKQEEIDISSVKYERKGELITSGLWVNLDEDNKIRKGSALAQFLGFIGVKSPSLVVGLFAETTHDDKGYLCFKAY